VTSWGINPQSKKKGSVAKALYEPEGQWDFVDANENTYKMAGIETRYFHFLPGPDRASPADDGGMMEIQVFRATAKRRCIPELVQYKNQEKYGISYVVRLAQADSPSTHFLLANCLPYLLDLPPVVSSTPRMMQCTTNGSW
jgi:hypothetical protein